MIRLKGHTHKSMRTRIAEDRLVYTCACGAECLDTLPGNVRLPARWYMPDIGHLWITRRTREFIHIGSGHIVELMHATHAGCRFCVLDPSHTFFLPPGASIRLFESVDFRLVESKPTWAKIRISAPKNIKILRGELHEQG